MPRIRRLQKKAEKKKRKNIRKQMRVKTQEEIKKFVTSLNIPKLCESTLREGMGLVKKGKLTPASVTRYVRIVQDKIILDKLRVSELKKRLAIKMCGLKTASRILKIRIEMREAIPVEDLIYVTSEFIKLIKELNLKHHKFAGKLQDVNSHFSKMPMNKVVIFPIDLATILDLDELINLRLRRILGNVEFEKLNAATLALNEYDEK